MDRFQYVLLMAACVVVTLPLEFVIGARVWRRPARTGRRLDRLRTLTAATAEVVTMPGVTVVPPGRLTSTSGGTGTDTRPDRVLNPARQAARHDPDGVYVRRHLLEAPQT